MRADRGNMLHLEPCQVAWTFVARDRPARCGSCEIPTRVAEAGTVALLEYVGVWFVKVAVETRE